MPAYEATAIYEVRIVFWSPEDPPNQEDIEDALDAAYDAGGGSLTSRDWAPLAPDAPLPPGWTMDDMTYSDGDARLLTVEQALREHRNWLAAKEAKS